MAAKVALRSSPADPEQVGKPQIHFWDVTARRLLCYLLAIGAGRPFLSRELVTSVLDGVGWYILRNSINWVLNH